MLPRQEAPLRGRQRGTDVLGGVHGELSQASCVSLSKVLLHPGHLCHAEQGLRRLIQPGRHKADALSSRGW